MPPSSAVRKVFAAGLAFLLGLGVALGIFIVGGMLILCFFNCSSDYIVPNPKACEARSHAVAVFFLFLALTISLWFAFIAYRSITRLYRPVQ